MKCQLANCLFKPSAKHQIHNHHIVPKELGGGNQKWNLIDLCPNCHSRIFIPDATKGIHSIEAPNSIIILGYRNNGRLLEYIDNGDLEYCEIG